MCTGRLVGSIAAIVIEWLFWKQTILQQCEGALLCPDGAESVSGHRWQWKPPSLRVPLRGQNWASESSAMVSLSVYRESGNSYFLVDARRYSYDGRVILAWYYGGYRESRTWVLRRKPVEAPCDPHTLLRRSSWKIDVMHWIRDA